MSKYQIQHSVLWQGQNMPMEWATASLTLWLLLGI